MSKGKYFNVIFKMIFLIIFCLSILVLFNEFNEAFNILSKVIIIIGFIVFSIGIVYEKNSFVFIGYLFGLGAILFIRNKGNFDDNFSNSDYFIDWIKILFTNKIVFINVFGNILLYMPFTLYMYIYIRNLYLAFFLSLAIIFVGEIGQYIFHIGVFDYIDILLNTIGVCFVVFTEGVILWVRKRKKKKN